MTIFNKNEILKAIDNLRIDDNFSNVDFLLELKEKLNEVNNQLTKITILNFLDWLKENKENIGIEFDDNSYDYVKDKAIRQKENSNGYDICINNQIYAEVKCNIPYCENKYGGSQQSTIFNDIDKLLHPDKHSKVADLKDSVESAYKFLVIAETKETSDKIANAIENLLKYTPHNVEKNKEIPENLKRVKILVPTREESLSSDNIYIVRIRIDKKIF